MSKTAGSEAQDRIRKEKAEQQANLAKQKAARETAKAEQANFSLEVAENDEGMRSIGEHLLKALHYGATQREVAEVIGKAASWVNRIKKWAETGYAACGPFSADGKARRKRDKAKSVLPAKQPGIGHNKPPTDPAKQTIIEFPENGGGSQPVLMASAEKPIEEVQAEFAALSGADDGAEAPSNGHSAKAKNTAKSSAVSDIALDGFTAEVLDLVRPIAKHPPKRFAGTAVPGDELQARRVLR